MVQKDLESTSSDSVSDCAFVLIYVWTEHSLYLLVVIKNSSRQWVREK